MDIFSWLRPKAKVYPEAVQNYLDSFKENSSEIVVFDTETTGLNPQIDKMVSVGAVKLKGNVMKVEETFYEEILIENNAMSGVNVHEVINSIDSKSEISVVLSFLDFIKNCTLVGHHIAFDVAMINQVLQANFSLKLKNRTIDTAQLALKKEHYGVIPAAYRTDHYTLDKLIERYHLSNQDRHHALGDAYITAELFLKIR
jgi:DNA polymerase-3 subunit epsilon